MSAIINCAEKAVDRLIDGTYFKNDRPSGRIKQNPKDFIVEEILSFTPSGDGEHLFLFVEKYGANTHFVGKQLARQLNVPKKNISYAGLKDRHAVTRQWYSLWLPGKEVDVSKVSHDEFKILKAVRHNKKLKPSAIERNKFTIKVSHDCNVEQLEDALGEVSKNGVPKYFGLQRFGHGGQNIVEATRWLSGESSVNDRQLEGLYLSSLRSFLFNEVLEKRLSSDLYLAPVPGDVLQFDGSGSCFVVEKPEERDILRFNQGDLHITGPLYGSGDSMVLNGVLELEQQVFSQWSPLTGLLDKTNLKASRAALRMMPKNLTWSHLDDNTLNLSFDLVAGGFATALLSHIFNVTDCSLSKGQ